MGWGEGRQVDLSHTESYICDILSSERWGAGVWIPNTVKSVSYSVRDAEEIIDAETE